MDAGPAEQNSPFYIHSNTSSSSTAQLSQTSNVGSQVSSVGFTNLKKLNTNTSQLSASSSSTSKTNPLTRLFTKNRSVSNVFQQPNQIGDDENIANNSDDDVSTLISAEPKKNANAKFRLPKNKLKFPGKTSTNKPDLSIQTSGHHGLKVSKKILSSTSIEEGVSTAGRKNSVSSPVSTFHNLFHRSHSSSQASGENQGTSNIKEESPNQQKINNPSRTTMTLSSSNSNSFITDINFAMVYNFTDPDYSVEEVEGTVEHSTLSDIHRKLMIPTDQYLQKSNHKHQSTEVGLGITGDSESDNEYLNKYLIDFGKKSARFYSNLLYVTRPLFLPSQQKRLQNGSIHPYMGYTIEDIANFIKDNYLTELSNLTSYDPIPTGNIVKPVKAKMKNMRVYRASSSSSISLNDDFKDSLDDFKVREISQDLFTYFIRCMMIFQKDFTTIDLRLSELVSKSSIQNKSKDAQQFIRSWARISFQWEYFNSKIRFYLLSMFQPLQRIFHDVSIQGIDSNQNSVIDIEIERTLLLAFRDIMLIPFLILRRKRYQELTYKRKSSTAVLHTSECDSQVLQDEETILKNNEKLSQKLINCLGVLSSNTYMEPGNADGEQHLRNEIFSSSFTWLSSL
ncbi:uncharacterized protein RJT20DRAFT_130227 [Scheffersomyces xylosifermentans]|uniref:uncharacterized protein n=1 Tax=Scheffersomyces xylosifermentans TaxID=1304137 RepID=UPI00315C9494